MSKSSEAVDRFRIKRRAEAKERLGGRCIVCGTTENLDFDHIDPASKSFQIATNLQKKRDIFFAEVDKCQLLCRRHHDEKTRLEYRLDWEIVDQILNCDLPQREIAKQYGVCQTTISEIKNGRTWNDRHRLVKVIG